MSNPLVFYFVTKNFCLHIIAKSENIAENANIAKNAQYCRILSAKNSRRYFPPSTTYIQNNQKRFFKECIGNLTMGYLILFYLRAACGRPSFNLLPLTILPFRFCSASDAASAQSYSINAKPL
jgi:hypothetical protein